MNGISGLSSPTLHNKDDKIVLNFAETQTKKPNGYWKSTRYFIWP